MPYSPLKIPLMENKTNGHAKDPGPPFAFVGQTCVLVPRDGVIELLEKNAQIQTKNNLALGPLFRKICDDFREFARSAEPGMMFNAPEANLHIFRLAGFAPIARSFSEEMMKRMQAEAGQPGPPNDRPTLIVHP